MSRDIFVSKNDTHVSNADVIIQHFTGILCHLSEVALSQTTETEVKINEKL